MSYEADPRVDAHICAQPQWQQAICREVREIVPRSTAIVGYHRICD